MAPPFDTSTTVVDTFLPFVGNDNVWHQPDAYAAMSTIRSKIRESAKCRRPATIGAGELLVRTMESSLI
jgi:hypothetical protein